MNEPIALQRILSDDIVPLTIINYCMSTINYLSHVSMMLLIKFTCLIGMIG